MKLAASIFAFMSLFLSHTHAALLLEDHFNYLTGNLGSTGAGGGWANSNSGVTASSNSLDGTSLGLAASSGNKVTTTASSSAGTYNQFAPSGILSGAVYFSCLLRVNSASGISTTGQPIVGLLRLGSQSSYYADAYLRSNSGNVEIGVAKVRGTPVWLGTPLTPGGVYLVVGKYEFVGGSSNDRVSLWLDPAALGDTEPAADLLLTSGGDGNDSQGIARAVITGGVAADVDELRVGTNWAEVTPTSGTSPGSAAPRFTQMIFSGGNLLLRGTNGSPNGAFNLLASASAELPLIQWGAVASNQFDANGNFDLTNPVPPGTERQFFRVRMSSGPPPPMAPQIVSQPQDQIVTEGQHATFTVSATGSAPLSYRWYFNTNTPVAGGTSATLTLSNVTLANAGIYSVTVTNIAGSITSTQAGLTVSPLPPSPPMMVIQPQSQTVTEGQTAYFSVAVTGTAPLRHQWYFNTTTALPNGTNATYAIIGATTNDAGVYSVTVTNDYGATNSSFALLTVNPMSSLPDFSHVGFAANGMPITGGAAGPTVYVGSESGLQAYSDVNPPYTIIITNSFPLSGLSTHIRNNKTVIGQGNIVLSGGGLYLYRATNVIVRNLIITGASEDGIGIHYSAKVWIDHCTFENASDGALDITQQSDNLTISWCRFRYTFNSGHNFVNLIASSDSDSGSYRTTFHHNWWDTGCVERMPSVRFGRVHCFNNYYHAPGNNYCVRTRKEAECRVENNFFQNVKNPWEQYITGGGDVQGRLFAVNNNVPFLGTADGVFWSGTTTNGDGTIRVMIPGTDSVFVPPYSYTLDPAAAVPSLVTNHAGAGRGPFAP